jgi:hypothetical protein
MAQAPDLDQVDRPPQRARARQAFLGPDALLTIEETEVTVANVDGGVELTITTENPDAVERLQQGVARGVQGIQRILEGIGDRQGNRRFAAVGFWGVLRGGEVALAVANVEKGVVLSIMSQNADVVKNLQDNMPQWVEQARDRRKRMDEARRRATLQAEVNRLIANEKIRIEFERTDDGLTVKFVSDDPELSKKLQEMMPGYFKSLQETPDSWTPVMMLGPRAPLNEGGRLEPINEGGRIEWVIGLGDQRAGAGRARRLRPDQQENE